jgi:hypothetical protein
VKPFRTIEDVHVIGATAAYLTNWTRRMKVSAALVAELTAQVVAFAGLADAEPLDPRTHLALHACHARLSDFVGGPDFRALLETESNDEHTRWTRDQALLGIASAARDARLESARRALGLRLE